MELEKGAELGFIYEGKKLLGLWFARSDDARNAIKIRVAIAAQEAMHGRQTDMNDYVAATEGLCEIEPGPSNIGGFVLLFPSMKRS